ncbi:MAG: TIGR02996 domain-containing protein [Planctomycetes bacterium]|nr:TIGR02996 domain-containing protein [Planctomycetota bacterium]
MNDRELLFAAILAAPDEDTPRLMYADWLMDNGDPARGNFVRLQVEAAKQEPFGPDARKLAAEAERAYQSRGADWEAELRGRVADWHYARGFVERVRVDAATFPDRAADLFAAAPVRALDLVRTTGYAELDPFFAVPQLAHVTRLDLSHLTFAPYEVDPLPACPHLANLTDLSVRGQFVMPQWLGALLDGPHLPALEGLDVGDLSHLGPVLSDTFPQLDHRRVRRLDLTRVTFSSEEVQRVLSSRCLREVEELRLGWLPLAGRSGPLALLTLGWVLPLDRLRVLDLSGQRVGNGGVVELVQALTRLRGPAPLRWLGLANNNLGAEGARALVNSDPARLDLYYLNVYGNADLTAAHRAQLQTRFPRAVVDATRPA